MIVLTIALWHQNVKEQRVWVQNKVAEEASLIEHRLYDEMNYSILAIQRMGQRWSVRGGTPEAEWRSDALNYLNDYNALRAIEWINRDYHIKWVEPFEENISVINKSILMNRETMALLSIKKGASPIVVSSPVNVVQGYRAIIVYYPLHVNGALDGYLAGLFDANKLVRQVMPTQKDALFELKVTSGDQLIYSSTSQISLDADAYQTQINVANKQWILLIKPKPIFFEQNLSFWPHLELFGGILFSLFFGSTLYYAITAVQRNKLLVEKSEALYKSQRYQQQLLNAIHEYAIYRIDINGVIESWNREAERIKGYTSSEILGRNFSMFFTDEDKAAGMPQHMLDIAAAKGKCTLERCSMKRDGSIYWLTSTVGRIKNLAGELVGFVVISQDITERRFLELEHKKLISIIEDSMEFIGMADLDGNLLYHNRSAKRMVGLPEDADLSHMKIPDMLPKWANDLIHDEGIPAVFQKGTWHAETALLNQITGAEVPVQQTLGLLRDNEGRPVCLTTVMRDITEYKKAEEAQENLISRLANSNMELERFAYVASHDMQEPLRMVVCFSDILANEYASKLNDEAKEYLNIVCDSGKRMQEMIQDLLEFSRVSNTTIISTEVDGAVALEHALDSMQISIQESKAQITFDILPKFGGNSIQFTRLLQNLISNAIKYQAPGSIPYIHIGLESQNEFWLISIKDNGVGIPLEFKDQIFQPFRRLHSWDAINGTGLGLAICKKIIENIGGQIWVESTPNLGSVFYFTIPKIQKSVDSINRLS
jgi:PAS domain S-box-containing protein